MAVLHRIEATPPTVTEPPEAPPRKRLWTVIVLSAVAVIVIGIVIGIVTLTTGSSRDELFSPERYRTGGVSSDPTEETFSPETSRDQVPEWMELDPWIERQLRLEELRTD